jgi:hypothetical protein
MAAFPLDDMDLIDDLHLSPSQGERLVAILALGKRPAPKFFRWLTERAVVSPYGTGARVVFGFVLGCGVTNGAGDSPVSSSVADTLKINASCSTVVKPGRMKLRSHRESVLWTTPTCWASSARGIPARSRNDRRRVPNGSTAI